MFDLISVAALTTAITATVQGASGEAGRRIWNALTNLVHKVFGRQPLPQEHQTITDGLADSPTITQRNPELETGHVINMVSGTPHIQGSIVQGRDFTGPITFDNPPREHSK
ncbi:MAG: hypothetical protein ACRDTG_31535 [Pseudonocardiaceae bacterium]